MSGREPWAALQGVPRIRPVAVDDAGPVAAFLAAMDRDGLYQRHFSHGDAPNLALLRRLREADGQDVAVLAAIGDTGEVIAHGEYVAVGTMAEFALMVLPAWRHRGVGGALLAALIDRAAAAGHQLLTGLVQASNTAAVQLARRLGFDTRPGEDRTTVVVSLPLVAVSASPSAAGSSELLPDVCHDPHRVPLHRRPGA